MLNRFSSLMLAAAVVSAPLSFAHAHEVVEPVAFHIEKRAYTSSTYFHTVDSYGTESTAVRYRFSPLLWASYSVSDADGNETGTIGARWINPGSFFAKSGDLDVRDADGALVGMIRGHYLTWAEARFSVYDAAGRRVADATLDSRMGDCLFTDPSKPGRTYGLIKQRVDARSNHLGFWEATVHQPHVLDPRLVHALAIYLADYESRINMNPEQVRKDAKAAADAAQLRKDALDAARAAGRLAARQEQAARR